MRRVVPGQHLFDAGMILGWHRVTAAVACSRRS
jgi:hypothetical protein